MDVYLHRNFLKSDVYVATFQTPDPPPPRLCVGYVMASLRLDPKCIARFWCLSSTCLLGEGCLPTKTQLFSSSNRILKHYVSNKNHLFIFFSTLFLFFIKKCLIPMLEKCMMVISLQMQLNNQIVVNYYFCFVQRRISYQSFLCRKK